MPLPLDLLHAVPLPAWSALLRAHGVRRAPKSLADVPAAVAAASPAIDPSLRTLRALAPDDARFAIVEAARELGVDTRAWPKGATNAELVATLVARAVKERAYAAVLEAATLRLCRRAPAAPRRRYVGRAGEAAKGATWTTTRAALKKFATAIERAGDARHAPGRVDASVASEDERRVVVDVVRPDPPACDLARGKSGAIEARARTPIRVDRLVIERGAECAPVLWVTTSAPELLGAYRAAAGEALLGDAALFASSAPISLRAIQRLLRAALDVRRAKSARLRDARIVSFVIDPGREENFTVDGRDVLAAVEREEMPLHGLLVAVVVRLDFDDGPIDVTLRVPNIVHWECDDGSPHDAAVRAFVDALGIDAASPENLVTLAPHDRPAWQWRAAIGDATFERFLAAGWFEERATRALTPPDCPSAGRILLAFKLRTNGKYYAVPGERFDADARVVGDADLVTYRLDVVKLATAIAREIGATRDGGEAPQMIERGTLIDLGEVAVGRAPVRAYLVVGARSIAGLAKRLRERSKGAQPVLVVPSGTTVGAGLAEVELASIGGPYAPLVAGIAKALGIDEGLDAPSRAPEGTRIAVDRRTGRTWIDGVEMVKLAESTRKLVRPLVEAGGKPVSGEECDKQVSGARTGSGAAKAAKAKFASGVRASFTMVGKDAPGDVEEMIVGTGRGYRIGVKGWIG